MRHVREEWFRQHRLGYVPNNQARRDWYAELGQDALAVYRTWRVRAYPMLRGHENRALLEVLPRSHRRRLRSTGAVRAEQATLQSQAATATRSRWHSLPGQDVVVWVDNWYHSRYRPDPESPNVSQDVSVMAVLFLTHPGDAPAVHTRSHTFAQFPGHSSLHALIGRMGTIDTVCQLSLQGLIRKAAALMARPILASAIRVPLDITRPQRVRRQWEPLLMLKQRVGAGPELLRVLEQVRQVQGQVGQVMPLMVDEKVHYSVMRLLYAPAYWGYDGARWLRQVPVLYGCWHPYKHTLTVVYRAFLPIFMALELSAAPRSGSTFRAARKVVFMERMVAALLLAAHTIRGEVEAALQQPAALPA